MDRLLLATGRRLLRLESQQGAWHSRVVAEEPVRVLAMDQKQGHLYAAGKDRVLRSSDGGRRWEALKTPAQNVYSIAASPADGAIYLGTEPSAVFRSRDHGQSWQELTALQEIPSKPSWSYPPRPWTHHVRAIAPSPHDPDRLLVGIELGGVMLSEDGGRSFSDHREGAEKDCHALAWHPRQEGRVYEAAGGGAAWSDDGGRTWQAADEGRDHNYCWALAVDAEQEQRWFISAAPGPRQAHSADVNAEAHVYRWEGKGPWRRADGGLPDPLDSMPYAMTLAGEALFVALRDGRLFAADSAGEGWRELQVDGPRPETVLAMSSL